jgi:hypothetical protein
MSDSFLEILLNELQLLLLPLAVATEDGAIGGLLFEVTGWNLQTGSGSAPNNDLVVFVAAYKRIDDLIANPPTTLGEAAQLLGSLKQIFSAARQIQTKPATAVDGVEQLGKDLIQGLVLDYFRSWHRSIYDVLTLLTVFQPPATILLSRISDLLSDPLKVLRAEYVPSNGLGTAADASAVADKLFPRLAALLTDFGYHATYGSKPENGMDLGEIGTHVAPGILTVYLQPDFQVDNRYGLALGLSSKDLGNFGLVVIPFGEVLPDWDVDVDLTAASPGFAVGPQGLTLFGTSGTTSVSTTPGVVQLSGFVVGSTTGTRLEIEQLNISGDLNLKTSTQEYGLLVDMGSCTVAISAGDGDGFLQSVLPAGGIQANFDLAIGWSNQKGLYFAGAVGMDATLPIGISIGGVIIIPTVHLGLQADNTGLVAEVSISIGVMIGPVQAMADRVGIQSDITFPQTGGNLGVADLTFSFKPPSGIGLAVDAAGVSGGGFLAHDDTKHEYMGVLQLQFTDLALQAFGLITTQDSDGSGYSLLAMIDADFPPVQLGWGFTLDGVGGLIAVHRSASVDALRAALKADKLSTIMFPKNAITNAPQILASLDTFFPTAPGRFLFGPMALIGWGTPTMLTAAVALIIELPEPIRIILLARIAVRMPTESKTLVRINLDALGVLDLGQNTLSLDASLFDSRVLTYTLSGDMALRASWGAEPREFLLSIGGFHPRFTPPSGFPTLKRLSIDMSSGSIATLHLDTYLAITSNTLQIGANLHVLVKVSSFSIDGHLGFDALFQRNPFHFDGDISGSVAVSIDGDDLLSVSLDAMLTGPAPWQVSGSFKVHIIFVDVSKSFSHTWGDSDSSEQIAPVDVGALLNTELADPRSWGVQLAQGTPALISSRDVQNATGVVAHPLAQLEVHERTVPLGMDITRFGAAPVTGASSFSITDFRIDGTAVPRASVQDDFAPAQFLDLTDDEKLAQTSFELHDAGVRLSGGLVNSGAVVNKTITYETFYVDESGGELRTDSATPPKQWLLTDLQAVLGTGSAGRASILSAGNRRYTAPGNPIQVADPAFVLVNADTLAPVGVGPASGSVYSNVQALMNQELKRDPSQQEHLQIVATHEMVAA